MSPATIIRSLRTIDESHRLYRPYRVAKRIAIGLVGGAVLLVGIAMIILPGPAFVVIPVGLGILSLEFAWARNWLGKIKDRARSVVRRNSGADRQR
jgi:tellurite resistance protein TerC